MSSLNDTVGFELVPGTVARDAQPAPVRQQQLRKDAGKPKDSYLLALLPEAAVALLTAQHALTAEWLDLIYCMSRYMRNTCAHADMCGAVIAYAASIDLDLTSELVKVYERGAIKYARGNYLKGQTISHYLDSAVRHLRKLANGESHDPETECHHLAHLFWNVERAGDQTPDRDDRLFVGNPNLG